jgi:pilus assembly protein Flp/PilA
LFFVPSPLPFVDPFPQRTGNHSNLHLQPHWRGKNLVGHHQEFWMRRLISAFLRDEFGATAIEYCLIAAGISIVIVVVVNGIGSSLNEKYASVNASLK